MKPDLRNPQMFLDDRWIEDAHRVQRVWNEATWYPEPVLRPTEPWEGHQVVLFGTVMRGEGFDGWRMYYTTYNPPEHTLICMAESDDGIQWRKPNLGLYEYRGSRDNNIVFKSSKPNDGGTLAYDEGAEFPYLLYYYMSGAVHIARSGDGINFKELEKPALTNCGDRNNVMLKRVKGKIVLVCRHRDMMKSPGSRSIYISESEDGMKFTEPELVLTRDLLDAPLVEYYGMSAFPYGDLYLGLVEYWHQRPDRIEIMLAWSDDLKNWSLPADRRTMLVPGKFPWNANWNSPNSAPPVAVGDQLWIYVGARSGAHHLSNPHSYGAVGLATVRKDRFCGLTADAQMARVVTKPMTWAGGDLLLNASTTRYLDSHPGMGGGEMRVEALDADMNPIDGFGGEDAADFRGNHPSRGRELPPPLKWGDRSLDELRGRTIRLRFNYRDAHLYSFKASR